MGALNNLGLLFKKINQIQEANYTSLALQMANEARTVGAIDNKFVDAAHKKAFIEMTEAGFGLALKNSRATKEHDTKVMLNKSYSQDNSHVVTQEVMGSMETF